MKYRLIDVKRHPHLLLDQGSFIPPDNPDNPFALKQTRAPGPSLYQSRPTALPSGVNKYYAPCDKFSLVINLLCTALWCDLLSHRTALKQTRASKPSLYQRWTKFNCTKANKAPPCLPTVWQARLAGCLWLAGTSGRVPARVPALSCIVNVHSLQLLMYKLQGKM